MAAKGASEGGGRYRWPAAAWQWQPGAKATDTYTTANPLNQYPGVDGAALSYDPNGNLTNDGSGGTYTYDAENRLLTAVKSGNSARYAYDPLGHRSGKTVNLERLLAIAAATPSRTQLTAA